MSKNIFESEKANYKFEAEEEGYINKLRTSVKEKADYDLRRIIGLSKRIHDKVATNEKNEYGDVIEDWTKITTKELIDFYLEGAAWNFYSTPIKMQAFIESSLAEIVYKYEFNHIISDPELKGTVGVKNSIAEIDTIDKQFAATYRKLYSNYVTELLRSFDAHLKRIEHIINWRQQEERMKTGNTNPF